MSAISNWTKFHSPGDKLSTFTRSEPVDANEKATELKKVYPRARSRRRVLTGAEAARALAGGRR